MNSQKINMPVSTLGPQGTCSEYACRYYLNSKNYDGDIFLYSTFEEAILNLLEEKSDCVIVPSAYYNLADIIFKNQLHIEIDDVFILPTPNLVIAHKHDTKIIKKVASHGSPSILAKDFFPNTELIFSKSNSASAEMLMANEVDACLTTEICAKKYNLKVIQDFGAIVMSWNVFKRKKLKGKKLCTSCQY